MIPTLILAYCALFLAQAVAIGKVASRKQPKPINRRNV